MSGQQYTSQVGGSYKDKKGYFDTLVAESLILNKGFNSKLTVVDDFTAQANSYLQGDVYMNGNVYIQNSNVQDFLDISDTTFFGGPVLLKGNTYLIGNAYLSNYLFLDPSCTQFLYTAGSISDTSGGLGINTNNPQSTLDICGGILQSINVFTSSLQNRNTIAQNNTFSGIVVNTTDISSNVFFFNDTMIANDSNYKNQKGDAAISYIQGNIFQLSNNTNKMTMDNNTTYFSSRGYQKDISNIPIVIYDISYSLYQNYIYGNSILPTKSITGTAISAISNDSSSNTFITITTPDGVGAGYGGGAYPFDTIRSMNTIGIYDISGNYNSAINIVSGNISTIGINTYKPRIDNYALDINGPTHIDNGDITLLKTTNQLLNGSFLDTNNSYYIYGVQDNSQNIISIHNNGWSYFNTTQKLGKNVNETLYNLSYYINCLYAIDENHFFVGMSDFGEIRYTIDGSNCLNTNLSSTIASNVSSISNIYASYKNNKLYNIYITEANNLWYCILDTSNNSFNNNVTKIYSFPDNVTSMFYINNSLLITTGISINSYNINTDNISTLFLNNLVDTSYNSIYAIDNTNIIAVGKNIITYTNNRINWYNIPNNTTLNSIYIYDNSNAIACGANNSIWISNNGFGNWIQIPSNIINPSGKGNLLFNNNNSFIGSIMRNKNTITLECNTNTNNIINGKIIECFVPNLFNRKANDVFDVCGNMFISGDIHINENGELISNNDNFNIFNRGVGNIFIGGDAKQLIIGNAFSGNTFIRHNIDISLNATIHKTTYMLGNFESTRTNNGTLIVSGGVGVSGNTFIGGNLNVQKNIETVNVGTGTVIVTGGTSISGNTFIGGNLNVLGNIESTRTNNGTFIVSGGVGVSGNTFIGGNLNVQKNIETVNIGTGTVIVTGGTSISGNTFIGGNLNVLGNIESTRTNNGTFIVSGGVGVSGNTFIGGNLNIQKNIESVSTRTGTLIVTGGVGISGNTFVGGNINIQSISNTNSTGLIPAALNINGGVNIQKNTYIGTTLYTNNIYSLSNTQTQNIIQAFNTNTGNTQLNIGLGISQINLMNYSYVDSSILNIGGINDSTNIAGNLNVQKNVETVSIGTGTLVVTGGTSISGNTFIGGNATIQSTSDNNTSGSIPAALNINGGINIKKTAYISGNLYTNNIISLSNTHNLNLLQSTFDNSGSLLTMGLGLDRINIMNYGTENNGIINIGGTNDTISINGNLSINGNITTRNPIIETNPAFILNNNSNYGSSQNFGIFIGDNQTMNNVPNHPNNYTKAKAFIRMSSDTYSFIFQPTANTGTNYYPNPIRFGENLKTYSPNSLLVIQPNTNINNHYDASYQIVSSYFDLSSVLQRDITNSSLDSQQVNTNLIIGNSTLKQSVAIGTNINTNSYSLNMIGNIYQNTSLSNNGFIIQF